MNGARDGCLLSVPRGEGGDVARAAQLAQGLTFLIVRWERIRPDSSSACTRVGSDADAAAPEAAVLPVVAPLRICGASRLIALNRLIGASAVIR